PRGMLWSVSDVWAMLVISPRGMWQSVQRSPARRRAAGASLQPLPGGLWQGKHPPREEAARAAAGRLRGGALQGEAAGPAPRALPAAAGAHLLDVVDRLGGAGPVAVLDED